MARASRRPWRRRRRNRSRRSPDWLVTRASRKGSAIRHANVEMRSAAASMTSGKYASSGGTSGDLEVGRGAEGVRRERRGARVMHGQLPPRAGRAPGQGTPDLECARRHSERPGTPVIRPVDADLLALPPTRGLPAGPLPSAADGRAITLSTTHPLHAVRADVPQPRLWITSCHMSTLGCCT